RPHSQGREAGRSAGGAVDEVRPRDQPCDRDGARPRGAADAARPSRRGDRVMKRREFITLFGGAAVAWPLPARAQQPNRMRRIGVLTPYPADEPEGHARLTAFAQALQQSGWAVGQNVQIDYRLGDGKPATMRKYAAELVALAPEVILASSSAALAP